MAENRAGKQMYSGGGGRGRAGGGGERIKNRSQVSEVKFLSVQPRPQPAPVLQVQAVDWASHREGVFLCSARGNERTNSTVEEWNLAALYICVCKHEHFSLT